MNQGSADYVLREIYAEALAKMEVLWSRLNTELEQLNFLLENELVEPNGDILCGSALVEVINNINADIKDTKNDLEMVNGQIKLFESYLNMPVS
jgi:hypothetical protein